MALQKVGDKVIAKLTDLTQETIFASGDRIVFWCSATGEAATIDWDDVKIDEDHTTFGQVFKEVVNFVTTASAWVETVNQSYNEMDSRINDILDSTNSINNEILAIKMLLKMILGLATAREDLASNFSEEQYIESLPDEAKEIYQTLKDEVLSGSGEDNIDFTRQNLIYLSSN